MSPFHYPPQIRERLRAAGRWLVLTGAGTSSVVEPAASLPRVAGRAGALVIEANPDRTPLSAIADLRLEGSAGVVLPAWVEAVLGGVN
jgi:NAD-dependent deacetylase